MAHLIPRKQCPKCHMLIEGAGVAETFSCDQCGNGYLNTLKPRDLDAEDKGAPLPRSGGEGLITHTRDAF